jgi:hypothetical protein
MANKKHNYSKIDLKAMEKAGNKSISGLIHKCVAVKKRGCK